MASKKLYIDKPGGAILQMANGLAESYDYGQEVNLDDVSQAQRDRISRVTTTKRPDEAPATNPEGGLKAAMIEANNVNTTASPIPGNYAELSEDEAVRLIDGCRDPQVQAVLVAHEIATQGRSKVIKAAPDHVQDEAEVRAAVAEWEIDQLNAATKGSPTSKIKEGDGVGAGPGDSVPVSPPVPGATPAPASENPSE